MLAMVATYGIGRLAYGVFVPIFREEFDLPVDVLGLVASAAQAGYLVATVVTGVLTARLGPRVPVVTGCLLLAVGAATVATAPGPVLLAVGIAVAGTSAGGTWAPFSDAIDDQVPPEGRRRALALVNAGSLIGLVVASGFLLVSGERWRVVWLGFAAIGLIAAAAAWRVLVPASLTPRRTSERPRLRWFLNHRSVGLFVVALGASVTSGAYFAFAPDTARDAGSASWTGAAMWAALGIAGGVAGVFAGRIADRFGICAPLVLTLVLLSGSTLVLRVPAGATVLALGSAALFGVGFAMSFALVAMWSQQVFHDRPATGFTAVIVVIAGGFAVGPGMFGTIATHLDRSLALIAVSGPALVAAMVSMSRGCPRRHR